MGILQIKDCVSDDTGAMLPIFSVARFGQVADEQEQKVAMPHARTIVEINNWLQATLFRQSL